MVVGRAEVSRVAFQERLVARDLGDLPKAPSPAEVETDLVNGTRRDGLIRTQVGLPGLVPFQEAGARLRLRDQPRPICANRHEAAVFTLRAAGRTLPHELRRDHFSHLRDLRLVASFL